MLELLDLLLIVAGFSIEAATTQQSGVTSGSEYVEYIPGNINLLISVPHDGRLKPDNLKDRRNGVKVNGVCNYSEDVDTKKGSEICKSGKFADLDSSRIAEKMADEFRKLSGKSPHLIIARLHRSKVDFNRDILEAAQKDKSAERIYKEYHNLLKSVRNQFKGPALIIDLHGQTHQQNSSELGYLIKKYELNDRDYKRPSSVRALSQRKNISIKQLLHGPNSLGAMFEAEGYKALPSPRQPRPGSDKYYRGGYITQQYGSDRGGVVDAIQIEVPSESRYEDGPAARNGYAKALARILIKFFNKYY